MTTWLQIHLTSALLIGSAMLVPCGTAAAEPPVKWQAGLSKLDITPTEPVRMAGYGSRDHPSEGVDTPLYVRCLVIRQNDDPARTFALISVDTIGLPGALSQSLAKAIEQQHGIRRDQIVFCSTHTHCGPDLISELSNIFAEPLQPAEIEAGNRYKAMLSERIVGSITAAIGDLAPANLDYAVGKATFAANRRVLKNGRWSGFGVQADGPVDHSVPVLRITDPAGIVRGVVFNYACHCTTLGGDHYRINGDWSGYAAAELEATYPGAVALSTIGCGADANPEPRGMLADAVRHGKEIAAEVERVSDGEMKSIDAGLDARFDYAALSFDLPTEEELQTRLDNTDPQTRRHAEMLLEIYKNERRLPATYPVPIQSWSFGDQLTMIFLGGEVVVDYALRLKESLDDEQLWVTAYANDVLGYIASERMRSEGGYEYDRSGVYYGLPGPWAAGTEDLLIERVEQLVHAEGRSQPLEPAAALRSMQLSQGFEIALVAAEPLVVDPINLAFGADGKLWVVEMGDYPEGENGGQIKFLTDRDGDGRYDTSVVFLSGLSFPTGVFPWRDGVIISAAPEILFARDLDGDGEADSIETLYSGFRLANPQHRINGFGYGLDHSLHVASGDNLGEIKSEKTGQLIDASGHDVQIWPDSGRIAETSGRTQFIRSRNDWGQWFGNDNSHPLYHFPIDDALLARNPAVTFARNTHPLFDPPVAPPVFPVTSASERFNDLFAANRFTSACSSIIARSSAFDVNGRRSAFVCEPVHNLVHRAVIVPDGTSFVATRADDEQQREFLASSDPLFRPVRAAIGPDGALWVVDMYREVIEHPEWIPQAWQDRLDLRGGDDRGRIYRITPRDDPSRQLPSWNDLSTVELVARLRSPIGSQRDMAQQLILERQDPSAVSLLRELAVDAEQPFGRVHALSMLATMDQLTPEHLSAALADADPGVLLVALRLSRPLLEKYPELLLAICEFADHPDPAVVMEAVLTLGESSDPAAGEALANVAIRPDLDEWLAIAVTSSATEHSPAVTSALLAQIQSGHEAEPTVVNTLLTDLLMTAADSGASIDELVQPTLDGDTPFAAKLQVAAAFLAARQSSEALPTQRTQLEPLYQQAIELAQNNDADVVARCRALSLFGEGIGESEREESLLISLVVPQTPLNVQYAAIDRLTELDTSSAAGQLLERWSTMSTQVRDHCVGKLLSRQALTATLISALEAGQLRVDDLSAAAVQQLTQTGSRSMKVRAERLVRTTDSISKPTLVQSYLDQLDDRGSAPLTAQTGRVLFEQHCAVCHQSQRGEQPIGASLDNLTDRSDRALTTAILDPNQSVDPKYQSYVIETVDGRVLVGVIEAEIGASLTIGLADGQRSVIRRDAIERMRNTGISLMPEGLERSLTPIQLRALIGYLQQLSNSPGAAARSEAEASEAAAKSR